MDNPDTIGGPPWPPTSQGMPPMSGIVRVPSVGAMPGVPSPAAYQPQDVKPLMGGGPPTPTNGQGGGPSRPISRSNSNAGAGVPPAPVERKPSLSKMEPRSTISPLSSSSSTGSYHA